MSKILLSPKDQIKLNDINLNQIKVLVNSFKIESKLIEMCKYKEHLKFLNDIKNKNFFSGKKYFFF